MLSVGSSYRQSRIHNADHIMHPSRNREGKEISKLAHYDYWFNIRDSRFLDNPTWNSFERIERERREDTTREEMNGEGAIFVVFSAKTR